MALKGTLKDFGIAEILQLIGQQAKSGAEPLRRARRRAMCRRLAGLAQEGHGGQIPLAGSVHGVVGARGSRSSALAERPRAALVGAEAPTSGREVVDRAADQWVTEPEAPRDVRVPHEVE